MKARWALLVLKGLLIGTVAIVSDIMYRREYSANSTKQSWRRR